MPTQVYEIYQQGSSLHLVMDLIEPLPGLKQSDLFEWIVTKGPLNTVDACKLLYQSASAMKYLNDRMIIHRDLKPENILLGPEKFDKIRVMDYGLARCFMEDSAGSLEVQEATANVGSGGYQAPETIAKYQQSTQYGKACDVWSLGVILYICVRGAPPFGLGAKARIADIQRGKYAAMSGAKWKVVDEHVKDLIKRMLVVDPRNRITVEEIMADPEVRRHAGIMAAAPVAAPRPAPEPPRAAVASAGGSRSSSGGGRAMSREEEDAKIKERASCCV